MSAALSHRRATITITASCLALSLYGLWWALPNTSEPDPDSSVPLTALRGASCGFADGWVGQHQPLHPMLIATLSAPYFAYLVATGDLDRSAVKRAYPYGLRDPETSLSVVILIGRILSAVAYLGLVWVLYRIGLVMRNQTAGIVLAALGATCYPFVYYGHVGNPDMLYTTLLAAALLSYLLFLRDPSISHIAVLASAAALSVSVKIQALPFVVGMVPAIVYMAFARTPNNPQRTLHPVRRGWLTLLVGALLFGATFSAANNLMFNSQGFRQWIAGKQEGVAIAQRASERQQGAVAGPSFAERTVRNLSDGVGLPVLALALAGIWGSGVARRGETAALLLPVAAYALFYWKVHADFIRYMFPGVLVLLVFATLGVEVLRRPLERGRTGRAALAVICVILLGYLGARAAGITWLMTHGSRAQAEQWIAQNARGQSATVEVHEPTNLRLPHNIRLTSLDPYTFHTAQRASADPRRHHPYGWSVPQEVVSADAVRKRAPDYVVLLPGEGSDDRLIEDLGRSGSGYARIAEFGGPTRLIRQPLFTNIPLVIYQRNFPKPSG